jgi:type II secretory pathway predicted ATPase ExeA
VNRKDSARPTPEDAGAPPTDALSHYYGFHAMPFTRHIPVDKLLPLPGQLEMQARIRQAMSDQGIAVVTGVAGCGKSTVLRLLVSRLDPNRVQVLYVPNPANGLTGIYRDFLKTLGHQPTYFHPQLVSQVRVALQEVARKGRETVILCEEAHRMTDNWLEDMRMLLAVNLDLDAIASLVLVGEPPLRQRLRLTIHEALWSRINVRYQLKPLSLQETAEYITHHVKVAGYRGGQLFSDGFIAKAFDYTRGVPRRINQLCTYALLAAKAAGTTVIDETIFQRAQVDLDEDIKEDPHG